MWDEDDDPGSSRTLFVKGMCSDSVVRKGVGERERVLWVVAGFSEDNDLVCRWNRGVFGH